MRSMVFIILQFAHESKAGRYGTLALFLALGAGMIGCVAQGIDKFFIAGAAQGE